ncbi:formylglycine-generating enzyme family protein [Niabella insulamsoli]|uniref:type IX secretion system lipoprotein PorK/GldK n=1 Tax=Niabella insulamsoli TaxID=3144874 RepID=UPI0031FE2108
MKKIFVLAYLVIFISLLANAQKGQRLKKLVGKKSDISSTLPLSVIEIPTGTFVMGDETDTSSVLKKEQSKPVLISGFYISQTEVTNAQYKEFVHWVRDSIAARMLGGEYVTIVAGDTAVNWKNASKINYANPEIMSQLGDLLLDPAKTINNKRTIDPSKLVYLLQGFNYQEAAKKENKNRAPSEFIYKYAVPIYPDTLCWMRDFGYSNNEQMAVGYFASAKYQNYPVVGVSWNQANAFCDWMTKQKINTYQNKNRLAEGGKCRLPTEAEWAYAASLNSAEEVQQQDENSEAPNDLRAEGKIFPVYVNDRKKGKAGLYNMKDNVSEWMVTSYYEGGENFQNRFNPDIQFGTPESQSKFQRRKVIRGGSWKDSPSLTTSKNRSYEDMDATHSYIGFRVVVNLPE